MTEQVFQNLNVSRLALAILIIAGAAWLASRLTRAAEHWSERYVRHRPTLMNTSVVLRFGIYISAVVVAARTLFTFSNEALLASAGAIALTFSLAFQDLASSFVGGITLLLDRPFQVGDRVKFKNFYGDIVEIGLRSVRLRTLDDSLIAIPNNQFLKEAVSSANAGALDMQVVIDFHLDPNSPVELAKRLVYEAVVTSKYAFLSKPVVVLIEEKIIDVVFTVRIRAKAYVFNTRYEKAFVSDVTERARQAFAEHGVRSASTNPNDARLPRQVGT